MNVTDRYFLEEANRPPRYTGQLSSAFQQALANSYARTAASACSFSHSLTLPDGRLLAGLIDLRGVEESFIGNVPLWGKRVFEYFPGSGGLSGFLASRAEELVVFDLPPGQGSPLAERQRLGWWYAKAQLGFEAQAVYADPYAPPQDLAHFDIAVLDRLFTRRQHPFLALQHVASLADTLVVIEPAAPDMMPAPGENQAPIARFVPAEGEDAPAHWRHTPAAIVLMLRSVGFTDFNFTSVAPRSANGAVLPHYTILARRGVEAKLPAAAAPPAQTQQELVDELPLPPPSGRFSVAGTEEVAPFVILGRAGHTALCESLARAGESLPKIGRILDFGCGVGRVLRYWHKTPGVEVYGTDINPESIAWAKENLSFAQFKVNGLDPRIDFPDDFFGFAYALSVFTHLPESIQLSWLRELIRVIRPGGLLYFTTHGDSYRTKLPEDLQAQYAGGAVVVTGNERPGSNYCGAFHPPSYVKAHLLAPLGLELVEFNPEGAAGNPTQDSWLVRKPKA